MADAALIKIKKYVKQTKTNQNKPKKTRAKSINERKSFFSQTNS